MYRDLLQAIADCFQAVADDYKDHEAKVTDLIDQCQERLEAERKGAVGSWEQRELDYARAALASAWLRLALTAAEKAILVSQLLPEEYEYGMNYGKHQA